LNRVGITGHQGLDPATTRTVREAIVAELSAGGPICGVSSLAEGADQLFAEEALRLGGALLAVVPSRRYEESFTDTEALGSFERLRERAVEVVEMGYDSPGEEAYWAAGQEVVRLSERMLAVWDGAPSGGLGGTADVVAFARSLGKPVSVIWPPGAARR
jgi:hypothetical protein